MLVYSFLIHNSDGSEREVAGRMALRDDVEAIAFGRSLIQSGHHLSVGRLMKYGFALSENSKSILLALYKKQFS